MEIEDDDYEEDLSVSTLKDTSFGVLMRAGAFAD